MTDGPDDPLSEPAAGAIQMHELMMAYCAAGFTRAEALSLVTTLLVASMNNLK